MFKRNKTEQSDNFLKKQSCKKRNRNFSFFRLISLFEVKYEYIQVVRAVLDFGGSVQRQNDLFGGTAIALTKRFIKGLKGIENIYTQHKPYISELIDLLSKDRLSDAAYPYILPSLPLVLSVEYFQIISNLVH